jgi:hypothetical protein
MGRKSRSRSRSRSSRRGRSTRSSPVSPPRARREKQLSSVSEKAPAKQAASVDFKAEYHYVYSDLKRIGVLATIMFAVLIAMALVVRL